MLKCIAFDFDGTLADSVDFCLQVFQKVFTKYKNIHEDKTIVLVATGPTLNNYETIRESIHIGVNAACCQNIIPLDYLFAIDYPNIKRYLDTIINYRKIAREDLWKRLRETLFISSKKI